MPEKTCAPATETAPKRLAERRAFVRIHSELTAACRSASGREVSWPGSVRDISRGGLGLLLRHRFRPGTRLLVELRDSASQRIRTISVQVVHATPCLAQGSHVWLLGCAFDEPLSDAEWHALS